MSLAAPDDFTSFLFTEVKRHCNLQSATNGSRLTCPPCISDTSSQRSSGQWTKEITKFPAKIRADHQRPVHRANAHHRLTFGVRRPDGHHDTGWRSELSIRSEPGGSKETSWLFAFRALSFVPAVWTQNADRTRPDPHAATLFRCVRR